jgi:hypothetical protein
VRFCYYKRHEFPVRLNFAFKRLSAFLREFQRLHISVSGEFRKFCASVSQGHSLEPATKHAPIILLAIVSFIAFCFACPNGTDDRKSLTKTQIVASAVLAFFCSNYLGGAATGLIELKRLGTVNAYIP